MPSRSFLLAIFLAAAAQTQPPAVTIWPNGAPGSASWTQKESEYVDAAGIHRLRNIVSPSITPYLPPAETATGTAVIVAPGGGFSHLSWETEGTMVADWLQQHGVAAFVLKYRLTDTGDAPGAPGRGSGRVSQAQIREMAAADGLEAIQVVRERAAEWHIDTHKIGFIGFSAGGYMAVEVALDHTAQNRPDFVGAIYPCCVSASDIKVPGDAPPVFFLHAYNDPISAVTEPLFLAWKAAGKPAELHTFAAGGHGFGMVKKNQPSDGWIERFGDWLRFQKLMK
jgi:acetyl esterase/lipase